MVDVRKLVGEACDMIGVQAERDDIKIVVDEPESAVTMAFSGNLCDSSQAMRMGFTGLADNMLCRSIVSHHRVTPCSTPSRQDRSFLGSTSGSSAVSALSASATMFTSVG